MYALVRYQQRVPPECPQASSSFSEDIFRSTFFPDNRRILARWSNGKQEQYLVQADEETA